jgi:phage major head subunit gpT-like protein
MLQGLARILVVPELSNEGTVWYLADVSHAIKPLVWQVRRENQMVSRDQVTDDGVWFSGELQWGVDGRYGKGYGPWWLMARAVA